MRNFSSRFLRNLLLTILLLTAQCANAQQSPQQLYNAIREKFLRVKDYKADVRVKVDVNFLKMPPLNGIMYYKAPDKLRMDRRNGVSLMPRRSVNFSIANLVAGTNVDVLDGGIETTAGVPLRILRVIPRDPGSDIVLARLWVDEARMLVTRTESTTRDDGTVQTWLTYSNYTKDALPDKILFVLDVKDFKMPKGVTMDYEGSVPEEQPKNSKDKGKRKKGRIEVTYLRYTVNQGLSDAVFKEGR